MRNKKMFNNNDNNNNNNNRKISIDTRNMNTIRTGV